RLSRLPRLRRWARGGDAAELGADPAVPRRSPAAALLPASLPREGPSALSGPATWEAVDRFAEQHLLGEDAALEQALQASAEAGLPPIAVTPSQGKLLHLLARSIGAGAILEVGTLGGY